MYAVHPLYRFTGRVWRMNGVDHMDALEHEHSVLDLDLAVRFRGEPTVAAIYPARLQRASKGADESATRGSYDIINCGGVRIVHMIHTVKASYRTVRTEYHRLSLGRHVRKAQGTSSALNTNVGQIGDIGHGDPRCELTDRLLQRCHYRAAART